MNNMTIYFHCSSRQGNGYVLSEFDKSNPGTMKRAVLNNSFASKVLVFEGFELSMFCENNIYYVIVKHIDAPERIQKEICDCSGARIYLNIVFASSNGDRIRKLAYDIISNFPAFSEKMYNAYNVDDNSYGLGYTFSYHAMAKYIDYIDSLDVKLENNKAPRKAVLQKINRNEIEKMIKQYIIDNESMLIAHISLSETSIKERFAICPKFIITSDQYRFKKNSEIPNEQVVYTPSSEPTNYKNIWLLIAAIAIIGGSIIIIKALCK